MQYMAKVHAYIYALRGWLAFVAFMDIGTAFRCFMDENFLRDKLYTIDAATIVHPAMARLFGFWSILNAAVLLHCALCIHYAPIYVMTMFSLLLSIFIYILEAFVYQTVTVGMSIIFPIAVNGLTVVLLAVAPLYIWLPEVIEEESDSEDELLRKSFTRRHMWRKKKR